MDYQTFEPNPTVNSFVKCYWTLVAPKEVIPQKQRIVPDGCMEMIFHHGDLFRQYAANGSFILQPRCFVFGQITTPLEIVPTGETGIFAVRFQQTSNRRSDPFCCVQSCGRVGGKAPALLRQ